MRNLFPEQKHPFLHALVRDLDREKRNFVSVMHFEADLQQQIIPMLLEKLRDFAHTHDIWEQVIRFLNLYELKVRYLCYLRTRDYVQSISHIKYPVLQHKPVRSLEEFALGW